MEYYSAIIMNYNEWTSDTNSMHESQDNFAVKGGRQKGAISVLFYLYKVLGKFGGDGYIIILLVVMVSYVSQLSKMYDLDLSMWIYTWNKAVSSTFHSYPTIYVSININCWIAQTLSSKEKDKTYIVQQTSA